jgi:hypothetical protein
MDQVDYVKVQSVLNIRKPKKLLLHSFSLSSYAYDIYALLLLSVKNDFDKNFFGIEPVDENRSEIMSKLKREYSFTRSQLSDLFHMPVRVLNKRDDDGEFFLVSAIQELRRAEITIFNGIKNNIDFRVTGLINNGNYYDGILTIDMDPFVCYEFIEYQRHGGMSLIDKNIFWKIRDPIAKKIFELIASDKRKPYQCNLINFLNMVAPDFKLSDFKQRTTLQKYLRRPIERLLKDSNGLIVKGLDTDGLYTLSGLSGDRSNSINEQTIVRFNLLHKEVKVKNDAD